MFNIYGFLKAQCVWREIWSQITDGVTIVPAREHGHRCSPMTVRHFPAAACVCLAHTQQFRPPSSQHNLIVQPPPPPLIAAAAADDTTTLLSVTTATTDHRCCSASAYGVRRSVRVRPPPVEILIVFFLHARCSVFACTGKRRRRRHT